MASNLIKPGEGPTLSRLTPVIDALREPIIICDEKGRRILENRAADSFFQTNGGASEMASQRVDFNNLRLSEAISAASGPGEPKSIRSLTLTNVADGSEMQFEAVFTPTSENDVWTGTVAVLREMRNPPQDAEAALEKLRAAEELVRQDRDRLNLVIENVGDPIIVANRVANITLLDSLARDLFDSMASASDPRIAANQVRLDGYLTAFTFSFLERQHKTINFYNPKSQTEVEYAARSGKIYDSEGQVAYTVTVLRDFSTWKRIERLQIERRMLEMEKFAATGKLAGTIAHEINNPMEAIKNAIYLLRDRLDPASQPIYEALKSETDRVTRILRQMLGLYRNAGHFGSFDLNGIVEDTLTLFSRPLDKAGIVVEKRLGRLPPIKGSADQFRQLLSNLVVNAKDSMAAGGRLCVRTHYAKSVREGYGQASIVVSDTGCGIPTEIRPTMFEPFITTKGEKGTGLGLWIVKGIVESHSGRIQIRSTMGRGTTFKLIFPVSRAEAGPHRTEGKL
jgi:signal transduction histidine kinase